VTIPAGASISGFAPLASPALTGTPTAPTASTATNTTQIATTAYVKAQAYATLASPTFTGTVTIPAGASITGYLTTASAASTYQTLSGMSSYLTTSTAASTYQTLSGMSSYLTTSAAASTYQPIGSYLTDAPSDGSTYGRLNGAWSVVGGGGSVAWGAITGTLSSQTDLQTALDDKLALAGGTMTGGLTLSATGIIFSDATTMTTAPAGSALAADQLTAGVVAANPTTGPTTAGDVLQYDGTDLIWAAGGGGGGVAWGGITGTLSSQTDLQTALNAKQNKSTLVTHSSTLDYYVTSASENGVVYLDPSSAGIVTVFLPDNDPGFEFANGCSVTICNNSGGISPVAVTCYGSAFAHIIYGNISVTNGFAKTFYKINGNDWFGA
jgi:hypothetical protein